MTTRRFFPEPVPFAENAARVKKVGIAAVPTTARAPLRTKTRRVMGIYSSWLPATRSWLTPATALLPSLKLGRSQQQSRDCAGRCRHSFCIPGTGSVHLRGNGVVRLTGNIARQQTGFQCYESCLRVAR